MLPGRQRYRGFGVTDYGLLFPTPSPVHALYFSRALVSVLPSLVDFYGFFEYFASEKIHPQASLEPGTFRVIV